MIEAEQRINIEKGVYFDTLWPDSENRINDNILNNNSLVCKLVYKNFSMLFTGDIESEAENAILVKYKTNLEILKTTVLKIAHHGSKTSSIQEFIKAVKPQIALIGVGKDNKFGHPSNSTIQTLQLIGTQIYRTDESGEIGIKVNQKGKMYIFQNSTNNINNK